MAQAHSAPAQTVESVRAQIVRLLETQPHIRISVAIAHSKVVQDAEVTITGVYRHVFCVEEMSGGVPQRHTFQYSDLITGRVRILMPDAS